MDFRAGDGERAIGEHRAGDGDFASRWIPLARGAANGNGHGLHFHAGDGDGDEPCGFSADWRGTDCLVGFAAGPGGGFCGAVAIQLLAVEEIRRRLPLTGAEGILALPVLSLSRPLLMGF